MALSFCTALFQQLRIVSARVVLHSLSLHHCLLLQVYRVTVEPLVHTLFNNGKATCFAYGQTGSGKTYTMSPLPIRAAADILRYLERPELRDVELYVSCFEIYGNKVFDLLNMRKKLNILEDGKKKVCVVGLKVRASCCGRTETWVSGQGDQARRAWGAYPKACGSSMPMWVWHAQAKRPQQGKGSVTAHKCL